LSDKTSITDDRQASSTFQVFGMSVVPLVPVDPSIASSYDKAGKTGGLRATLTPIQKLGKAGVAVPEVAHALLNLSNAVQAAGGDFRVTELHRDVGVQQTARAKYDNWVKAGKPSVSSSGFDAKSMKAAFVALPGRSFHNAGRAIDVHLSALKFPGVPANRQLDKLWEIAVSIGWSPIINFADEGANEAWHFDYYGDLQHVLNRLGYEETAKCGAILVGHSGDCQTFAHTIQALLQRAGFDIGKIDGVIGPKTMAALVVALGVTPAVAKNVVTAKDEAVYTKLCTLPFK
jgi:D-alanyl-D-alanine dipeptidase